jgi:hypothetical protein
LSLDNGYHHSGVCQKSAIGAAQFSWGITSGTMEATIIGLFIGNCICIPIENGKKKQRAYEEEEIVNRKKKSATESPNYRMKTGNFYPK